MLIHAERAELIYYKAFVEKLAHVAGDFIEQLDSGLAKLVLLVVGKFEREAQDMLLPVLFDDSSDVSNDLNGAVTDILFLVVEQLVKQWEDRAADALVSHLTEILRNQRHQWSELIQ